MYYAGVNKYTAQRIQSQLVSVAAQIAVAESAIVEMTAGGISSFEIDTGEADQKVIFRNIKTFQQYLDGLYAREEWLLRRLRGGTMTSVKVRRKP